MKASIKFRDDNRPLLHAKVPVGVLGLPFLSGLSAGGDANDLRFDLSTAFTTGSALRLSYRPNDPLQPFALSIRTGLGPLGSPTRAPFALAAEFNVLSSYQPTSRSSSSPASGISLSPAPFAPRHRRPPRPPRRRRWQSRWPTSPPTATTATRTGRSHSTAMGLRRTLRPPQGKVGAGWARYSLECGSPPGACCRCGAGQACGSSGDCACHRRSRPRWLTTGMVVMNKITIEQMSNAASRPEADRKKKKDAPRSGEGEEFSLMKRQLEALNAESTMLRRAVKDLRAEIGSGKCEDRKLPAAVPSQLPFLVKPDHHYHGNGKELGNGGLKPASWDEASEELKKALEARRN